MNRGNYNRGKKDGAWTENTLNSGSYKDGQREGTWIFRHDNLRPQYEKNYVNGKEHGRSVQYDTTGKIIHEEVFEYGRRVSTTRDTTQLMEEIQPAYAECDKPEMSMVDIQSCTRRLLLTHILNNLKYPAKAREIGFHGKALIQFTISQTGEINNIQVINGICNDLRMEVYSVAASLPPMKPGYQDGKPVDVKYTLPIDFRLE